MAALTNDVDIFHAHPVRERPMPKAGIVDTFYRGALVFYNTAGQITPVTASGSVLAGIVAERTVIATINDPVPVYEDGLYYFAAAVAALANNGELMYALATSDNPADITATATANSAAIGILSQRAAGIAEGWFLLSVTRLAVVVA